MEAINKIVSWLQLQDLMDYGVWDFLINIIAFSAIAVPLFLLFWIFYKEKFRSRRIQPKPRNHSAGLRMEIKNSIISLMIFTAIDIMIYFAQLKGYTQIYTDVHEYGWAYLAFSVVIIILFHDTYVYFIHRFMHLPGVYEVVHKVHHQSVDPSPFATFSFHPIEAVLEAFVYVFLAFLLPVHLAALWTWQILQIILSVIAHLGYEIYPRGFNTHWLFKFKTPSTHHNMHHSKINGNYGLYFTWWDRFFGTEFEDYNQTYEALQEKINEGKGSEQPMPDFATE